MNPIMQQLVSFLVETQYEDLPQVVSHEAKRLLLDSIGVAIAGLATDKGQYAIELVRQWGGKPEATILGIGEKLPCPSASFVNAELINALDMDATLMPAHVTPFVLSAPLAVAESRAASGKAVILAVVLAHEITVRMSRAMSGLDYLKQELGEEAGGFAPIYGYNLGIFGGAAGVGKILNLDKEKMAHALGIASYSAPVPASVKLPFAVPPPMVKYAPAGWMAQAEVISALLAERGYTGDTEVLDGEHGFWKFMPDASWKPELLTQRLGERWGFLTTHYKPYPCCRLTHSGLDGFISIIERNNLYPEDIEEVKVWMCPLANLPLWSNREIRTQVDAQFSVAYAFAAAAHRIKIGADWQDKETIKNPRILEFMSKVSLAPHPEFNKTFQEDPHTELSLVEVVAKGQTFRQETRFARGTHSPAAFRMTDEELINKFKNNTSRVLPSSKIKRAVKSIFQLEKSENVAEVIKLVTL